MLSGCVGAQIFIPTTQTILNPAISPSHGKFAANNLKKKYTCSYVEEKWGKPSTVEVDDNKSTLLYSRGSQWVGVMPFLIIPIPLVFPVGTESITIECENDIAIKAHRLTTWSYICACSLKYDAQCWCNQGQRY